jgi:hypothetical protein
VVTRSTGQAIITGAIVFMGLPGTFTRGRITVEGHTFQSLLAHQVTAGLTDCISADIPVRAQVSIIARVAVIQEGRIAAPILWITHPRLTAFARVTIFIHPHTHPLGALILHCARIQIIAGCPVGVRHRATLSCLRVTNLGVARFPLSTKDRFPDAALFSTQVCRRAGVSVVAFGAQLHRYGDADTFDTVCLLAWLKGQHVRTIRDTAAAIQHIGAHIGSRVVGRIAGRIAGVG